MEEAQDLAYEIDKLIRLRVQQAHTEDLADHKDLRGRIQKARLDIGRLLTTEEGQGA